MTDLEFEFLYNKLIRRLSQVLFEFASHAAIASEGKK